MKRISTTVNLSNTYKGCHFLSSDVVMACCVVKECLNETVFVDTHGFVSIAKSKKVVDIEFIYDQTLFIKLFSYRKKNATKSAGKNATEMPQL